MTVFERLAAELNDVLGVIVFGGRHRLAGSIPNDHETVPHCHVRHGRQSKSAFRWRAYARHKGLKNYRFLCLSKRAGSARSSNSRATAVPPLLYINASARLLH
jgi:hypothetical protein